MGKVSKGKQKLDCFHFSLTKSSFAGRKQIISGNGTTWEYIGELDTDGKACGQGFAYRFGAKGGYNSGDLYLWTGTFLNDKAEGICKYQTGATVSVKYENDTGKFEPRLLQYSFINFIDTIVLDDKIYRFFEIYRWEGEYKEGEMFGKFTYYLRSGRNSIFNQMWEDEKLISWKDIVSNPERAFYKNKRPCKAIDPDWKTYIK